MAVDRLLQKITGEMVALAHPWADTGTSMYIGRVAEGAPLLRVFYEGRG